MAGHGLGPQLFFSLVRHRLAHRYILALGQSQVLESHNNVGHLIIHDLEFLQPLSVVLLELQHI